VEPDEEVAMSKTLIFIGMAVGGWLGWWLGERFGIMTAFILSTAGSIGGVVLAWWIGRRFLS
jgi:predicted MFS family arabinose efflux permease